jgi:hypothetical protein
MPVGMMSEASVEEVAAVPASVAIAAMSNDPADAEDTFTFAGVEYPVLHLKYKDYMSYLATVQPVIGSIIALLSPKTEADLELASIVSALSEVLPSLVKISIKQSDPTVSLRYVEENATSPFELISIIEKQIKKNGMVEDFRRFFGRYQAMMSENLLGK